MKFPIHLPNQFCSTGKLHNLVGRDSMHALSIISMTSGKCVTRFEVLFHYHASFPAVATQQIDASQEP
jgi:hypothetical protein